GGDAGANTVASPRTGTEVSGRLWSGLAVVRPFAFTNASGKSPFGLVGRYDHVSPTTSTEGIAVPPPTDNSYHTLIGGLFYDLNSRARFALDYQESLPTDNGVSLPPPAPLK